MSLNQQSPPLLPFWGLSDLAPEAEVKGLLCGSGVFLGAAGRQEHVCPSRGLVPSGKGLLSNTDRRPSPHSAGFCVKENR